MIARTQGIPITAVATSEVEGTNAPDNWQNIMVKGSSSIQTPADLAGKTIAVNALKGVGEVMIKAALEKSGVDPNSIKLLAVPFPTMRSALANGQVDAAWMAEPFMSQMPERRRPDRDGTRPGARPVLPDRRLLRPVGLGRPEPGPREEVPDGDEPVAPVLADPLGRGAGSCCPAASQNTRLPIWTTLVDRQQLLDLARYAKKYGVITSLPNLTQLVPSSISGGSTLQGTVGASSSRSGRTAR